MPDNKLDNNKAESEEEASEFKVTDRRKFTTDGDARADPEPVASPKEAPSSPPPPSSPASGEQPKPSGPKSVPAQRGPVNFQHLVFSLTTTAMFQLGLMGNPEEERPKADVAAAQETIDLLNVLEKKTKGNLTPEEERLLTNSLYELRMCFVEISRKTGGSS